MLRSAGTDINFSLALALVAFAAVQISGITSQRVAYLNKFLNVASLRKRDYVSGLVNLFSGLLHLVTELSRILSFTFRLFGAMTAGEVLLLVVGFLIPAVIPVVFYGLELFVGLIQGLIFAALTVIFARLAAVSEHSALSTNEPKSTDE